MAIASLPSRAFEPVDSESVEALSRWLAAHGLSSLQPSLLDAQLELDLLGELDDAMLARLGVPLGMRLRLLRAVRESPATRRRPHREPEQALQRAPERRQLSVMFCDIVDSTTLATRLDAEDLRCVLDGWRQRVIQTMQPAGAYLSQFLGDGALLYFGYPQSGEDDAENAVRAALTLLNRQAGRGVGRTVAERVGEAGEGTCVAELVDALRLRIGIATGPVVLDRLTTTSGQGELSAVGRIPHLAARLQGIAQPGRLCVDERTARLCGNAFELHMRPPDRLRGFAEPVKAYTVLGMRRNASRFEARHAVGIGAFIGRAREMAYLQDAAAQTRTGRAKAVLLEGEPGMGKSRLCFELLRLSRAASEHTIVLQCSPFHVDSPLHAVAQCVQQRIETLRKPGPQGPGAAHTDREECDALTRLAARLEQDVPVGAVGAVGCARDGASGGALCGSPADATYRRREALLTNCIAWLRGLTASAPLTVLLEDLHWCDATTLELLERVVSACADRPVLLLVTTRPGGGCESVQRLRADRIVLTRLERQHVAHLLQRQLRTHRLPAGLCEMIDERTDGVPLFIEELARSLCESGQLQRCDHVWRFDPALSGLPIPDTLQASLAARLDLLDERLRTTLRMAACLGRSFAFDDLAELLDQTPAALQPALDRLVAMQLMRAQDGAISRRYEFRHALVRDVAWAGVLHADRRALHDRVQRELLARRSRGVAVPHDRLAHHLEGAGERDGAIRERRAAARLSAHRSANPECRSHLLHALALIEADPARASRLHEELAVLLELIPPCRMVSGFAAAEVVEFTQRALALADAWSCDRTALLQLVYFEWAHEYVSGDRGRSIALAQAMLARAAGDEGGRGDDDFRMTALGALGASLAESGRLHPGIEMLQRSLALYRPGRQGALIEAIGMDARVVALGHHVLASWCIGERALAHRLAHDMLAHAAAIAHAPSQAFALFHSALLSGVLEQCTPALLTDGEALRMLGRSHRFASWEICGELLCDLGSALEQGSSARLARVERTLRDSADMGLVYHPLLHDLAARACLAHGERDRAGAHLAAAFVLRTRTGERWSDARLWLTAGEIAADAADAMDPGSVATASAPEPSRRASRATTCLRAAIRHAERSGATVWLERARRRLQAAAA